VTLTLSCASATATKHIGQRPAAFPGTVPLSTPPTPPASSRAAASARKMQVAQ
jgi:hypothetical protein